MNLSHLIADDSKVADDGSWRCRGVTSFAERLQELRAERGLTQAQLAEVLKLDRSAVSHWEGGRRMPDAQLLQQLAGFFGVSLDYLCGRDETAKQPDEVRAILRSLNGLGEAERAEILEYIAWKRAQKRRKDADQADNPVTPEGGPRP